MHKENVIGRLLKQLDTSINYCCMQKKFVKYLKYSKRLVRKRIDTIEGMVSPT